MLVATYRAGVALEMEFRLLGPVGVWAGDRLLGPSSAHQRSVLAILLLNVNHVVSLDRMVDAVWGDQSPASASNALQGYISRLRRLFAEISEATLATVPPGYRLDVDPMRVDLYRFRELVDRARTAGADDAAGLLTRALRLWTGPPLADVAGGWLPDVFAASLEEERLAAVETRIAIDLRSGRHRESLTELPALMKEHPLRERLVHLAMTALHRDGRRSAALELFRDARRRLVDELGIEPGRDLQHLHRLILAGRPVPGADHDDGSPAVQTAQEETGEPAVPVPAELPADTASFTGRSAEVTRLSALLGDDGPDRVRMCQISGIGGIGKSSLAIHIGHRIAERFPDGQLYVNLRGATPEVDPLEPGEALGRLLRSLGVAEAAVPADVEEAAGRFRSLTDGKRVLVVLDNAHSAAQIRPLLPGSPTCAVLVTSRRMFTTFEAAVQVPLDVLPLQDGLTLMTELIGRDRIAAELEAAAEVIRLCGNLPLALCLAAARLNARPRWPVSALAERLSTARRRLDELQADDRAVRAGFQGGYQDLLASPCGTAAARMFRLLGLLDGPDVSLAVAAALAHLPVDRAQKLLDHLVDAQLVENHAPDRYRLHDLLRLFARERAHEEEDEPARRQAVLRVLHCHLATARTAVRQFKTTSWRNDIGPQDLAHPGLELRTSAEVYAWIDSEESNVLAAVAQAARTADAGLAVVLAVTFAVPLFERGHWLKQLALGEIALRAAERTGDEVHQALIYSDLGWAQACLGSTAVGIANLRRALAAYERLGDRGRQAALLDHIGVVSRAAGRFDEAVDCHRRALRISYELGGRWHEGVILSHLGLAYQRVGRFDEAIELHLTSIAILDEIGATTADSLMMLVHLAEAYRQAGMAKQAVASYRRALEAHHDDGHVNDYRDAAIQWGLGLALHDVGEPDEARRLWRRSATILRLLGLITVEEKKAAETAPVPATPTVIRRQL